MDILINDLPHLRDAAFPRVFFAWADRGWLNREEVLVLIEFWVANEDNIVWKNLDSFRDSDLRLDFFDTRECVTHYGDQHVKESDLSDEGRNHEDRPDNHVVTVSLVVVYLKLSQWEHVLVSYRIQKCKASKRIRVDSIFALPSCVHDENCTAKSHQNEQEKQKEGNNVADSLANQVDIEWSWIKETHPVERFDPHQYNEESWYGPLCIIAKFRWVFFWSSRICVDNYNEGEKVRWPIKKIVNIFCVVPTVTNDCHYFKEHEVDGTDCDEDHNYKLD